MRNRDNMAMAAPRPRRLLFFRHGETAWSISRQHTGRTDLPLTSWGEAQACALKPWVDAASPSRILASPRLRARQTCELSGASEQPEIEPDAAEWDYGDFEGRRSVDIRVDRPDWDIYRDGCPNGETPAQISARADRLIEQIRAMCTDVALFSHGQFGIVLAARWIGLDVSQARHFAIDTASMSILTFDADHPETPVIALWNAVSSGIRL